MRAESAEVRPHRIGSFRPQYAVRPHCTRVAAVLRYERVAKILINVKAGVEHLADMLEPIKIGAPPMAMTDDTVVEVHIVHSASCIDLS